MSYLVEEFLNQVLGGSDVVTKMHRMNDGAIAEFLQEISKLRGEKFALDLAVRYFVWLNENR